MHFRDSAMMQNRTAVLTSQNVSAVYMEPHPTCSQWYHEPTLSPIDIYNVASTEVLNLSVIT